MTKAELLRRMSSFELTQRMALEKIRAHEREQEAKRKNRVRKGR